MTLLLLEANFACLWFIPSSLALLSGFKGGSTKTEIDFAGQMRMAWCASWATFSEFQQKILLSMVKSKSLRANSTVADIQLVDFKRSCNNSFDSSCSMDLSGKLSARSLVPESSHVDNKQNCKIACLPEWDFLQKKSHLCV